MKARQDFVCFHPSTLIATQDGYVRIDELRCGQTVLAWSKDEQSLTYVLVERVACSRHAVLSRISLTNGVKLKCTPDHPIWVEGKGWCSVDSSEVMEKYGVAASALRVGDKCLYLENGLMQGVEVVSIELIEEEQDFYTISAGDEHCFFANGILVHDENVALLDLKGTGVRYEDLVSEPA